MALYATAQAEWLPDLVGQLYELLCPSRDGRDADQENGAPASTSV